MCVYYKLRWSISSLEGRQPDGASQAISLARKQHSTVGMPFLETFALTAEKRSAFDAAHESQLEEIVN